ncbi:MAG: nucleotide exchange factor GrpE [Spirochaetia bacterium]|nr:nucleotide exchange factor GrpE [Spirochaetia bacterium]
MSKKEKKVEPSIEEKNQEVTEKLDEKLGEDTTLTPELTRINELEEELEKVKKDVEQERDSLLRKSADMDNYRKRLIREKESAVQYANERLINDLIPVLDDFDRAIDAAKTKDFAGYVDGVKIIRSQLLDILERNWGLKAMNDIVGTEFSPHEHEAMMMETSDQFETETVLAELQKGYYLHTKVLRHAKVKVGKPS